MIRACPACGRKNRTPSQHLADTGRCGACQAVLPPVDWPLEVSAAEFDDIVGKAKVPVLVDFWADWCGPCKMAAPEVSAAARERAGRAVVLKVDTDRNPALSARYGIRGIPNFMVFSQGRPVMQRAGAVDRQQLVGWIDAAR